MNKVNTTPDFQTLLQARLELEWRYGKGATCHDCLVNSFERFPWGDMINIVLPVWGLFNKTPAVYRNITVGFRTSSCSVTLWSGHQGPICSNGLTKITVRSTGSVCCMCYPVTVRRRIAADQLMHCLVAGSGTGRGGGPRPPAPARQSVLHRAPGQVGSGQHDLLQVCA